MLFTKSREKSSRREILQSAFDIADNNLLAKPRSNLYTSKEYFYNRRQGTKTNETMKTIKQMVFWAILICINLAVLEIVLSLFYFQNNCESSLALAHYWHKAKQYLQNRITVVPVGIWQDDPKFGYSHRANTKGSHRTLDFKANYTIGADQERYISPPAKPLGRILFLGCSFTFGHGVDDQDNYPAVLAKEYWKDWHIVNKAVMGWGTAHAYQQLLEEMEKKSLPSLVIYAMLPHHITRNYIRKSWVETLSKFKRKHPHFEIVGGELEFKGVIDISQSREDSPELRKKEIELTIAFLNNMQKICKEKGIPFLVILLPSNQAVWPAAVIAALAKHDIQFVDMAEMEMKEIYTDQHPAPAEHRRIAKVLADAVILDVKNRKNVN